MVSVCVPIVTVEAVEVTETEIGEEGGGLMMWLLVWTKQFVVTLEMGFV